MRAGYSAVYLKIGPFLGFILLHCRKFGRGTSRDFTVRCAVFSEVQDCVSTPPKNFTEQGVSKWPSLLTAIPLKPKANLLLIQILRLDTTKRSANNPKWRKPEFAGGALALAGRFEAGALANDLARFSACLR